MSHMVNGPCREPLPLGTGGSTPWAHFCVGEHLHEGPHQCSCAETWWVEDCGY